MPTHKVGSLPSGEPDGAPAIVGVPLLMRQHRREKARSAQVCRVIQFCNGGEVTEINLISDSA